MDYTKGRNLYSESKSVTGYIVSTAADIAAMNAVNKEHTSDWISVANVDSITIQAWVPDIVTSAQMWIGYAFYEDKNMSSHIGNRYAKYGAAGDNILAYVNVTVPDEAKYIRVSYRKYNTGYIKVEYGSEATPWTPAPEDASDYEGGWNS